MRNQTSKNHSHFFLAWLLLPPNLFVRKALPVLYLLFLQAITGIPKAEALRDFNAYAFAIKFSEKLYDYPYWLQDLSHLPLFLLFTWFAHWFFAPQEIPKKLNFRAISVSVFYAIFNEGIQAIIPDRFPSPGDLIMNLAGVSIAIYLYRLLDRQIYQSLEKKFL